MKQLLRWTAKNLIRMAVLLLLVSAVSFFLVSLSPVDPLQSNVGQAALGSMSREQVENLKEYWGVGVPAAERFASWFSKALSGDMGTSLLYRRPVMEVIGERFLSSLRLMASAWVFAGVLGIALGILAGTFRGKWPDRLVTGYCMLTASTPSFWIGLVLLLVFAVKLRLFPIGFGAPIGMDAAQVTAGDRISHAFLPALTLGLTGISGIALHTRAKMSEIMESPYVLYARARGESTGRIVARHGLRNVLLPAVTLQFASVSEIFGGSILVEQVFSYPGLGQAAVTAGMGGDVPLLLGITLISACFVFAGNLAADALYLAVDPRMRRGAGSERRPPKRGGNLACTGGRENTVFHGPAQAMLGIALRASAAWPRCRRRFLAWFASRARSGGESRPELCSGCRLLSWFGSRVRSGGEGRTEQGFGRRFSHRFRLRRGFPSERFQESYKEPHKESREKSRENPCEKSRKGGPCSLSETERFAQKRFPGRRARTLALLVVSLVLLTAVTAAGAACADEAAVSDFARKNLSPGNGFLFGTDWLGRDMFLRTIAGLSMSIRLGLLTAAASTVIALVLGTLAAMGKTADAAVSGLIDLVMGIPHMLLLILISYACGKGFSGVVIGISLTHWPSLARLIRAEVMQIRESQYVKISEKLGMSPIRIAWEHMLPQLAVQFLTGLILMFPHAILHEASITFLGFGLPPEEPAVGIILSESMKYLITGKWWLAVFPGLSLTACVLLFEALGRSAQRLISPGGAHE